jgi:hypothetical protein
VANGITSVAVTHNHGITPTLEMIHVTPTNNLGNASHFWVADPTSSDFDIHVDSDPGTTTATFVWEIQSSL